MLKKVSGIIAVTILLLSLTGCDPEMLIKSKVPEPIQNLLTFVTPPSKIQLNPSVIEFVSPKKDAAYKANEDTIFEVKLKPLGDKPIENPAVSWVLHQGGKGPVQLGTGLKVKRKLDVGRYRAEATLTANEQKVSQSVTFREALISTGRVILTAGTPLSGVDVELLDRQDTVAPKSHSGNDGKFSVEFPTDGAYRLTVSKKGYSFVPLEMAVKYSPDAKIEFTGSKASISDILVTESEESNTPLLRLCPNQEVFFRAKIQSEGKASKIDVQLVHQEKEGERTHSFEHIGTGGDATSEIQKLKVPAFFGPTAPHYRLRVNVVDEKGNRFSANSREQYTIDMQDCFRKKLAEAIATHQKGNLAGASERYTEAEEYNRIVSDPAPFSAMMQKILFNRGLSDLSTALGMKPGDSRRSALLSKAVQDFNAVIKIRKSNVDALFFRGVLSHLSRSYEAAIQDYSGVILSDPNFPGILKLRALAYIRTGIKKDLLLAIYDLNEALKLNPDDPVLRKTRAETLKAYAADLDKKDDSVVDTSQIQLPNIEEGLNLKKIQQ